MSDASSKTLTLKETPDSKAPGAHKHGVPWSPATAVVYTVVVFFLAQFVAAAITTIYPHVRGWDKATRVNWLTNTVTSQFWVVLLAEVLTFGAIWWFIRHRKARLRSIGWRKVGGFDIVYALAGFAAYFVVLNIAVSIATHLFHSINVTQKQQLGFTTTSGAVNLSLIFISLVVLPPLVEETVFRGFMYTGLRNKLKPVWAALITSLLFASAHLQFGTGNPLLWVAAIDTFTLSLVLCYLRQTTDSLIPGIFLHAIKNSVAFITLFLIHSH